MIDSRSGHNPQESVTYYCSLLKRVVEGKRVILAFGPAGAAASWVKAVLDLGSLPPFVIVDALPEPSKSISAHPATWYGALPSPPSEDSVGFQNYAAAIAQPGLEMKRALDEYDPDRSALVLMTELIDVHELAGRTRYNARPSSWAELDDKTGIDSLWRVAGISQAPSIVIPVMSPTLRRTARIIDRGLGTVWAGDNRGGIHFGGTLVRWVQRDEHIDEALQFFSERCGSLRIMPFLAGLPCSIHGLVLSDEVIVFRPVENIVLTKPGESRFFYAGTATFWDPCQGDREAIRAIGSRVGRALAQRFKYRGFFTIDGILTTEGFLPTEMNARMGAGVSHLAAGLPAFPLELLSAAIRAGENLDFRPSYLEDTLVQSADICRRGSAALEFQARTHTPRQYSVVFTEYGCQLARQSAVPDGTVLCHPAGCSTFVTFIPALGRTPIGSAFSIRAASALNLADALLETKSGPFQAPTDVRAGLHGTG